MATQNRQSQLYRHLPFLLPVALILVALGLAARADDIEPSYYEPARGDSFFLLSESNFDSSEPATLRLEVPEGSWKESELRQQYSGVDIVLYRVPDPIAFLRGQKNLHRVQVPGDFRGEGLANALRYTWDGLYKESRLAWQRLFSEDIRKEVVAQAPELKQTPPYSYSTRFDNDPQYRPLAGFDLVTRFRYPLWDARPLEPLPVTLAGSSSNFIEPEPGNLRVPLGKLKPGLYLVEGILAKYRATALVFVSDTVAVTKVAGDQTLVWTARRKDGRAVAGSRILLTDGVGTLESGTTADDGTLTIARATPEKSYVIGTDPEGGVFVSENYYYDSEIYAAKLYAFTDRPLYQPGDKVCAKLFGRVFQDARNSQAIPAGEAHLAALDPNGTPVSTQPFAVRPDVGGDTCFTLPEQSLSGGYTLSIAFQGRAYTASFRVAEYVKPHYELEIVYDRDRFKTGEPVTGQVRLTYPGSKPVKGAEVELSLRSQPIAMVEGEAKYQGLFPVKLVKETETADDQGVVRFELPAARLPSRYVLRVVSRDGAAYRVSASRELIVEAGAPAYTVTAERRLTRVDEAARFTLWPLGRFEGKPAKWELIRLEDQSRTEGALALEPAASSPPPPEGEGRGEGSKERPGSQSFAVPFTRSGSYTLNLLDGSGNIVGTIDHWVAGPELKSLPGSISVVLDKAHYRAGETAQALITFPEPVEEALLTLERDRVEHHALLSAGSVAIKVERRAPNQWAAAIPVDEGFSPNITFSVLYVRGGAYLFQNRGIKLAVPRILTTFQPDKPIYRPGEKVTVEVTTTLDGKPLSAHLAVGVVDESVYVLQPEIAPDIADFFYHVRRDQVRTTSSIDFHTYDLATPAAEAPGAQYSQRTIKSPERPRRENIDTAAWFPDLETDEQGKTRFSFILPDSIARWRITGRALSKGGSVGQSTAYLDAYQDIYLKWTGPAVFRQGDAPKVALMGFNGKPEPVKAEFIANGLGAQASRELTLKPGGNDIELPLTVTQGGFVNARLAVTGEPVEEIQKWVQMVPEGWPETHSQTLSLDQPMNRVQVPEGARNLRLTLAGNATDAFLQVAEDLIDYPWGCVEQTASRVIPLGLAYGHLRQADLAPPQLARLHQQLTNQRLRLALMAGPNSAFGWWGDVAESSAFLTAYAYYADRLALEALGVQPPPGHWNKLLEVYMQRGIEEPPLRQALILWMAQALDLPTRTLLAGTKSLILAPSSTKPSPDRPLPPGASRIMEDPESALGRDAALVLLGIMLPGDLWLGPPAGEARVRLATSDDPFVQALLLLASAREEQTVEPARAEAVLRRLRVEMPTVERALALSFVQQALGGFTSPTQNVLFDPGPDWKRRDNRLGSPVWNLQSKSGDQMKIANPQAQNGGAVTAYLSYEQYGVGQSTLPVRVERHLYRLRPADQMDANEAAAETEAVEPDAEDTKELEPEETTADQPEESVEEAEDESAVLDEEIPGVEAPPTYAAELVEGSDDGFTVNSSDLYLDEVTVTRLYEGQPPFRFGVVEVALPPGAEVERTTWGISVTGLPGVAESLEMPESVQQTGKRAYALPVTRLDGPKTYRHLIRFGQRGSFGLPPARYYPMYRPTEQAYEGEGAVRRVVVE